MKKAAKKIKLRITLSFPGILIFKKLSEMKKTMLHN